MDYVYDCEFCDLKKHGFSCIEDCKDCAWKKIKTDNPEKTNELQTDAEGHVIPGTTYNSDGKVFVALFADEKNGKDCQKCDVFKDKRAKCPKECNQSVWKNIHDSNITKGIDHPVGDPFEIPDMDENFICEEITDGNTDLCPNCALKDLPEKCYYVECQNQTREDGKDVIVKMIPKNAQSKKQKNSEVKNRSKTEESEGKIEEMNPDDLTVLQELQTRVAMNEEAIEDYCNLIRNGMHYKFPPLEAVKDINKENVYYLYDGFHRLDAFKRVAEEGDYQTIFVRWRPGTLEDALWYAIAANQEHGIRRTNEDKRNAVLKALEHPRGKGLSDRALADWVGVSAPTVSAIRNSTVKVLQLKEDDLQKNNCKSFTVEQETRIGKDGKRRKMPTRTSSEPSFSTPPEPFGGIGKAEVPEWFLNSDEKKLTQYTKENLKAECQRRVDDLYNWLKENGLVTEYYHTEEMNMHLYKGIQSIGWIKLPFLPPHKMPDND